MTSYSYMFKCIIIGDTYVGKSNILLKPSTIGFMNEYEMTIGVEFCSKVISVCGKAIKLQIWDAVKII